MTVSTLQSMRTDQAFDLFWTSVLQKSEGIDVEEPTMSRMRKCPKRFEIGGGDPSYPQTPKDHYRRHFFENLDFIISAIKVSSQVIRPTKIYKNFY